MCLWRPALFKINNLISGQSTRRRATALLLLTTLISLTNSRADTAIEVINPQKSFGYFIGDVLIQQINLDSTSPALILPSLENNTRVNEYVYRLSTNIMEKHDNRWLIIEYQINSVSPNTSPANLPAIELTTQSGFTTQVEKWPFSLSTLIAPNTNTTDTPLPDHSSLDLIRLANQSGLKFSLIALAATLLLWLTWWLLNHFRDPQKLPIAKAYHQIRRLAPEQRDNAPEAWIAMHHAFNQIAGKTINTATTNELMVAAPWLAPFKVQIDNFYTASSTRFFKQSPAPTINLQTFCQSLRRVEKSHAVICQ